MRSKPRPWPWCPEDVARKWRFITNHVHFALPYWESGVVGDELPHPRELTTGLAPSSATINASWDGEHVNQYGQNRSYSNTATDVYDHAILTNRNPGKTLTFLAFAGNNNDNGFIIGQSQSSPRQYDYGWYRDSAADHTLFYGANQNIDAGANWSTSVECVALCVRPDLSQSYNGIAQGSGPGAELVHYGHAIKVNDSIARGNWDVAQLAVLSTFLGPREIRAWQADPFGWLNKKTSVGFIVSAAGGPSTIAATWAEGASAGDTFSTVATLLASITEGAKGGDSDTNIATLLDSLIDGALAGDANTVTAVLLSAMAEGAAAGESWAITMTTPLSMSDGSVAGDTFAGSVLAGIVTGAITEGSKAGDLFVNALNALAGMSEGASAGDTVSTMATLRAVISEGGSAGDTMSAIGTLLATISEGASAGDSWSASVPGTIVVSEQGVHHAVSYKPHNDGITYRRVHATVKYRPVTEAAA